MSALMCKQSFVYAALRIKKALRVFRELIATTRITRVAFWDPPSGSKIVVFCRYQIAGISYLLTIRPRPLVHVSCHTHCYSACGPHRRPTYADCVIATESLAIHWTLSGLVMCQSTRESTDYNYIHLILYYQHCRPNTSLLSI